MPSWADWSLNWDGAVETQKGHLHLCSANTQGSVHSLCKYFKGTRITAASARSLPFCEQVLAIFSLFGFLHSPQFISHAPHFSWGLQLTLSNEHLAETSPTARQPSCLFTSKAPLLWARHWAQPCTALNRHTDLWCMPDLSSPAAVLGDAISSVPPAEFRISFPSTQEYVCVYPLCAHVKPSQQRN